MLILLKKWLLPFNRKVVAVILLLGFLAILGGWAGGVFLSIRLMEQEAESIALRAAEVVRLQLVDLMEVVERGQLTEENILHMGIAAHAASVARYRIYGRKDTAVIASDGMLVGHLIEPEILTNFLRQGKYYFQLYRRTTLSGVSRMYGEVYTPIFRDNEYKGALEVYVDITDIQSRTFKMRQLFFGVMGLLVLVLGGMIGFIVWLNERAHLRSSEEIREINRALENHSRIINQDLKLAAEFQRGILTSKSEVPFLDFAVRFYPATEVSGDLYDLCLNREGEASLFVGDATGHGVAAAFLTMMAHMGLNGIKSYLPPSEVIQNLNDQLMQRSLEGKFLVGIFTRITTQGLLRTANAGHLPLMILPANGEEIVTFEKRGLPLGCFEQPAGSYGEEAYQLEVGDKIIVATDGLTEWHNSEEQQYGMERFISKLNECRGKSPEAILDVIEKDVRAFSAGHPPQDDITLLALTYTGSKQII